MTTPGQVGHAIAEALRSPPRTLAELDERLASVPPGGLPLDRWSRWLVMVLDRHLERQRWMKGLVDRLDPGRRGSGRVPGEAAWRYQFHGIGCCLTHDDGTTLDVDFHDGTAEWIDPYFFERWLTTSRDLTDLERPLQRPDAVMGHWQIDLAQLVEAGWLAGPHAVRFTDTGRAWANALRAACNALKVPIVKMESNAALAMLRAKTIDELRRVGLEPLVDIVIDWRRLSGSD